MRSTRACLRQVPHSQQSWCLAPKGRKYWLVTCTKCNAVHKFCGTSTYVLEMMPLLQEPCRCAKLSLTNTQILVLCVFFDQTWSCCIYQHFVPSHIFLHSCFFSFFVPFDSYRVLSLLSRLLTRPLSHRPPSLALPGEGNFFPARETELSCFSRVFHQCKGRDRCKRQPRLESHAPVSRFLLESLCSAVHSGASQPM